MGYSIPRAFRKLKRWHKIQSRSVKLLRLPTFYKQDNAVRFKSTLKGIRLICSGPPYKAKRKIKKKYHLWVADEFLTGKMPLQTFDLNIDYYQSFVRLKRATLGIKVWTLFQFEDKSVI